MVPAVYFSRSAVKGFREIRRQQYQYLASIVSLSMFMKMVSSDGFSNACYSCSSSAAEIVSHFKASSTPRRRSVALHDLFSKQRCSCTGESLWFRVLEYPSRPVESQQTGVLAARIIQIMQTVIKDVPASTIVYCSSRSFFTTGAPFSVDSSSFMAKSRVMSHDGKGGKVPLSVEAVYARLRKTCFFIFYGLSTLGTIAISWYSKPVWR